MVPNSFDLFFKPPTADPANCGIPRGTSAVPTAGINELVPELDVSDLQASLRFWCGLLGFEVAYDRPAARFAYLVRGHIQIMLCERNGNWEVGELSPPFGRGVNFQMTVIALAPIVTALRIANWPLFRQETTHGAGLVIGSGVKENSWSKILTDICCDLRKKSELANWHRITRDPPPSWAGKQTLFRFAVPLLVMVRCKRSKRSCRASRFGRSASNCRPASRR